MIYQYPLWVCYGRSRDDRERDAMNVIWHGLKDSFLMAWEVWWALVIGFAISGIVQAWVPRERIEKALSGSGPKPVALATGLGAASSSCSYAAIAIAKSLFQKGASATTALAFQFASTNLVWELGLVLWVLIGWQFTIAEYVGGIVMIVLMAVVLRAFVSPRLEAQAREHAQEADTGHQHHLASEELSWRERLTSFSAWSDVAHNFRGDWQMLWKEILTGFVLAGFVAQLGNGFFNGLFLKHTGGLLGAVENVIVGPTIAVLSFVCSVGNVPLAAVLWSGGISFAGVLAFLFADLIVLPIIAIYRKYYGTRFALRIVALMFVTMVVAALIVNGLFSSLGLIPTGPRPSRGDIFGSIQVDYKLFLNIFGVVIFAALFWLTGRRGVTDPVCGMKVDRAKELDGETSTSAWSTACTHSRSKPTHTTTITPGETEAAMPISADTSASGRGIRLRETANGQISELIALLSKGGEAILSLPVSGREKMGDGTIAACASHTASRYQLIAEFLQAAGKMPASRADKGQGRHRIPRFLLARGHGPASHAGAPHEQGMHGGESIAEDADLDGLLKRLSACRDAFGLMAELSGERLETVPPAGSFRFCDGQRTLEQVVAGLLKHQGHQVGAIRAAVV
jgi:uncharacterized membrane protein YraQ (UPF0718 family)